MIIRKLFTIYYVIRIQMKRRPKRRLYAGCLDSDGLRIGRRQDSTKRLKKVLQN